MKMLEISMSMNIKKEFFKDVEDTKCWDLKVLIQRIVWQEVAGRYHASQQRMYRKK